jgi:hypothetical protein
MNIALAMPDHMNPFYGRFNRLCIHPIRIILLQPCKQPRTDQLHHHHLAVFRPIQKLLGEAVKPAQTCGVAVDGQRAGRECRATLVERGGERRPYRGRVGRGEGVVLVEDDAAEAGAAELGPVQPPDVLHRDVWKR